MKPAITRVLRCTKRIKTSTQIGPLTAGHFSYLRIQSLNGGDSASKGDTRTRAASTMNSEGSCSMESGGSHG